MKKSILSVMIGGVALLSGCATAPAPTQPVDRVPALVGMPFGERLATSNQKISEQFELLNVLAQGKPVNNYELITHNNNLDARVGSDRTIPYSYAFAEELKKAEEEQAKVDALFNKRLKKINWEANSANLLAQQFSKALGYELVLAGNKDQKVNFAVENVTIKDALVKFQSVMEPVAQVLVVPQNKTINIIYK